MNFNNPHVVRVTFFPHVVCYQCICLAAFGTFHSGNAAESLILCDDYESTWRDTEQVWGGKSQVQISANMNR